MIPKDFIIQPSRRTSRPKLAFTTFFLAESNDSADYGRISKLSLVKNNVSFFAAKSHRKSLFIELACIF